MKIRYILPIIALLPPLLSSFKSDNMKERSDELFNSVPVLSNSENLVNGEGIITFTDFQKTSVNLESEVSTMRTRETSGFIQLRNFIEYENSLAIVVKNE